MDKVALRTLSITVASIVISAACALPALPFESTDSLVQKLSSMFTSVDAKANKAVLAGKEAYESLPGTGTGAGYVLGHGNIIPESETVIAAGSRKVRGQDYHIDYASGSIFFEEPVAKTHAVTVRYRYAEGDKGERTLVALPGLALVKNDKTSLNLTYAYKAGSRLAGQSSSDLTTFGFNSTTKLGKSSQLKSMFYVSTPKKAGPIVNHLAPTTPAAAAAAKQPQPVVASDNMIVEEGQFGVGRVKLNFGYQDVGERFAGMASLQESGAAPADVLNQLAKEKGLRRLDLGANVDLGHGMALTASTNSVKDNVDDLTNRSLGFSSKRFKFNMNTSDIGAKFTKFAGLKEANRDVLAKEKGLSRSELQTSYTLGKGMAFSAATNSVKDKSAGITNNSFGFTSNKYKLSFGSSEIGEKFSRFGDLREANKDVLTKEKGLRRSDFQADIGLGEGMSFSAKTNSIADKNDKISSQSLSFTSDKAKLNYSTSAVGSKFGRAKDIREANRDQLGKEVGMSRSSLGLELVSSGAKNAPWNALRMNSISDATGSIDTKSLSLNLGKVGLGFYNRTIDKGFARMGSLTKDDQTQLALEVRQMFDSGATVAQVTDADRLQTLTEAGISRNSMKMGFAGKTSKTDFQMLHVGDEKGGVDRRSLSLSGKNYGFSLTQQDISSGFKRLGQLSATEKAQFGNEWGMSRTALNGSLKLNGSDIGLGFSSVTDDKGASITKQSLSLANKKLNVKANFLNSDSRFERAMDLADADKAQLQKDRGTNRTDIAAAFTAGRLSVDSFYLTANNSYAKTTNDQLRNKLSYTTKQGMKLGFFQDSNTTLDAKGKNSGYKRQFFTFDNKFKMFGGLLFNGLRDVNTATGSDGKSVTSTINQTHLETNKASKNWAVADLKNVDSGNGKYENTNSFNFSSKPMKAMSLTGSLLSVARDSGSEDTRTYGVQYALTKMLNLTASAMDKNGSKTGATAKRDYTLAGTLAEKLAMFRNIKVNALRSSEDKDGKSAKDLTDLKLETELPKLSVFQATKFTASSITETKDGKALRDLSALSLTSTVPHLSVFTDSKLSFTQTSESKDGKPIKDATNYSLETAIKKFVVLRDGKITLSKVQETRGSLLLRGVEAIGFQSSLANISVFKNGKISFTSASEQKDGKFLKGATAAKFESMLFKGNLLAEFASSLDDKNTHPVTRGISYVSDRAAKKLQFDIAYKLRDLGKGDDLNIRKYGLNYKLSPKTTLAYNYFSLLEKPDGKIDQVSGTALNLTTQVRQFAVALNFKRDENFASKLDHNVYGLTFGGKTKSGSVLEFGYSFDHTDAPGAGIVGHILHAKYDRKIDENHYLSLVGDLKSLSAQKPGVKSDLQARIDFKSIWN